MTNDRVIHLDADAFFASVEQASDPRLRGRPVAVGGERRGIIASASYEARKFGIYTPMPTVRARRLCPRLVVLPGDFEKYERFSHWMFSYAYDFTPEVEVTSIDEGYFGLSSVPKDPVEVARTIRDAIRGALKITVSEGIGSNKLVSQVASKLYKPAAFHAVPAGGEIPFLHPLPNPWLPGVGPKLAGRLNAAGLALIRQVASTPVDLLELLVGSAAPQLRRFANGIDERPIIPGREPAKSYSQQETFAQDQTDEAFIEATLRRMADELMAKVRADGKAVRTLTVKVRYNDMAEDQRSESLAEPTDLETEVYGRLHGLLREAWKRRVSLRLVSLKLSNLYAGVFCTRLALDRESQQGDARRRLARVVDELRQVRGRYVILRGHDFVLRDAARGAEEGFRSLETGRGREPGARPLVAPGSPAYAGRAKSRLVPPGSAAGDRGSRRLSPRAPAAVAVLPLVVRSHYSFLDSTLSPEAIVALAQRRGLTSVALCDRGNLHGAVPFVQAAKAAGLRPIVGAELRVGGRPLWLYVETATGYANLCRLLSHEVVPDALQAADGLVAVAPDASLAAFFPGRFYLGVESPEALRHLAGAGAYPAVALRPVHYAVPGDRWKYDILQSIRTLTLLRQAHPEKRLGGAFHWGSPDELAEGFRERPELVERTQEMAERCAGFELPLGPPQFPAFSPPEGSSPRTYLRRLVFDGMHRRYPASQRSARQAQIEAELQIIHDVGYEEYFLGVWGILQACRERGIDWLTRGSAADSLVCYCLGISSVCPVRFDLYFRRFLNRERMALHKLPDIDIDFPHDRKDDVIDLIFEKYGAGHCAVVGGFSTFQARSAFAEVAKVLGVAEREVRRFTEHFPWGFGGGGEAGERRGPLPLGSEPPDPPPTVPGPEGRLAAWLRASPECRELPLDEEPYRSALVMAESLDGVPRYPKMHPCGVVLSRQPMHELTPTFVSGKGYPTTHFNMDAVEAVGLVKMDVLAQGGLAVMRDVRRRLQARGVDLDAGAGLAVFTGGTPPCDDPAVWEMIASGGARAVHHIESPAMTSLCRMTNVREIDGLIAIVSVIRPGAANEQKKVKFTRRYQGLEPPDYPHPWLEPCLRSTFGLVVYEEHILQICEAFAGLEGGQADVLRRALVKQQWPVVERLGREFMAAARARGHDDATIREVWTLVTGFNGYAFCKAHSTAYGVEAYQSAWLKHYYPAEFMAAVLTHGKGFYHPLVYVLECHRLGLPLLPPCVNEPGPDYTVVPAGVEPASSSGASPAPAVVSRAIRVPVSRIKGLGERLLERLWRERGRGAFASLTDFYRRVAPLPEEMELLIRAGAFDGFGLRRTAQFWEAQRLHRRFGQEASGQGWLLDRAGGSLPADPIPSADDWTEPSRKQRLQWEMELLGFAASGHPLELHDHVAWETYCPVSELGRHVGEEIVTCGLVIEERVHHQVTGEPMKFLTLCDWTGMVETELFAPTYKTYGLATVRYPVLEIAARVEPFENGRGHSLRALRAGKPRERARAPG